MGDVYIMSKTERIIIFNPDTDLYNEEFSINLAQLNDTLKIGEYYYYKIKELPKIKEITSTGCFLSANDDLYILDWDTLKSKYILSNIDQISCNIDIIKYGSTLALRKNDSIFEIFGDGKMIGKNGLLITKITTPPNIIEILHPNYALDSNMTVYEYERIYTDEFPEGSKLGEIKKIIKL